MTTGPCADGYAYLLPNGWLHLDLDPAHRQASVRRAVRRRVRREPRLAPYLAYLDRLMLAECVLAAAQGAERVSLLAEPVRPADGHAVTASVTLVVDRADVDRADVDRADVAAARPDAQAVFDWLVAEHDRVRAADPLATMDLTVLGQQSGVRRTWTASPPAGPRAASKHWQLVLPWPGRSSVALLTMASPCEPLWPQLEETFDACTRTFRWTWSSGGGGPGSD